MTNYPIKFVNETIERRLILINGLLLFNFRKKKCFETRRDEQINYSQNYETISLNLNCQLGITDIFGRLKFMKRGEMENCAVEKLNCDKNDSFFFSQLVLS